MESFVTMPPLEVKTLLFRKTALGVRERRGRRWQRRQLIFEDIKEAHINGRLKEGEAASSTSRAGDAGHVSRGSLK